MATLTIRNETGALLKLPTPTGTVKVDPNGTANLTEQQLKSQGISDAVYAGEISIENGDGPPEDVAKLALSVLPPLVMGGSAKLTQQTGQFDQSQQELKRMREAFNRTWKNAESSLGSAQALAGVWPDLRKAVKTLILDVQDDDPKVKEKKDALQKLKDELEELKKEDLTTTKRTMEQWYADRVARDQKIKAAEDELAKLTKEHAKPIMSALTASMDAMEQAVPKALALAKNKEIGREIPEFGK